MKRTLVRLLGAAVFAATLGLGQPATCQTDGCGNTGCNDDLPCPGANCGCVKRPELPFGRCVAY